MRTLNETPKPEKFNAEITAVAELDAEFNALIETAPNGERELEIAMAKLTCYRRLEALAPGQMAREARQALASLRAGRIPAQSAA